MILFTFVIFILTEIRVRVGVFSSNILSMTVMKIALAIMNFCSICERKWNKKENWDNNLLLLEFSEKINCKSINVNKLIFNSKRYAKSRLICFILIISGFINFYQLSSRSRLKARSLMLISRRGKTLFYLIFVRFKEMNFACATYLNLCDVFLTELYDFMVA